MSAGEPPLKVEGLTKRFSTGTALAEATLEASAGKVHGICGVNGAGKSTLIKMLTPAHWPDCGAICTDGSTNPGIDNETDAIAAVIVCDAGSFSAVDLRTKAQSLP
jgi:ABC-type sugar transport system ATPase subunit